MTGRTFFQCFVFVFLVAYQAVAMSCTLHCSLALDTTVFQHVAGMTGFTFFNFLAFNKSNLFAVCVFAVMALAAFQFLLIFGMGEYCGFFGTHCNFSRSLFLGHAHADKSQGTDECEGNTTD
jgi:hypothetical protein